MDKFWYLSKSDKAFYISDNPVALQNTVNKSSIASTLGLMCYGIEIYFPLSDNIVLCLLCNDLYNKFVKNAPVNDTVKDLLDQINSRSPLKCKLENIENINSLQILSSERFIFSSKNDFSLVEKMLEQNPNLKMGPRLGVQK